MRSIDITKTRRWVVKIGSALLTDNGQGVNQAAIAEWVKQLVALKQRGLEIVLVSSGAVAEGMVRLGWEQRPTALHQLQAAAAVGQMGLVSIYEDLFQKYQLHTAQILLTHDDIANRKRYLNARQALEALIALNVIPIVNENDSVATDEIRFGDNDTLAGMVVNLIDADQLVILTDQQGLFSADPRVDCSAYLLSEIRLSDQRLETFAQPSRGALGRGGMTTKLRAARLAAQSGAHTLIASGLERDVLLRLYQNETLGSLLLADSDNLAKRKQWLAAQQQIRGTFVLDGGAERALTYQKKSLLAVGVIAMSGEFERGDLVACVNAQGKEIARGLVNYASTEALKIIGKSGDEIKAIASVIHHGPEIIARDNLVLNSSAGL